MALQVVQPPKVQLTCFAFERLVDGREALCLVRDLWLWLLCRHGWMRMGRGWWYEDEGKRGESRIQVGEEGG